MMSAKYGFVMMIQPKWWNEFNARGDRKAYSYVLKGGGPPKEASVILFYVTKPVGELSGYAEFIERKTGDPKNLWKKYGHESVLDTKEKFDEYIGEKEKASFIRFKNLRIARKPIPLSNILLFFSVKRLARIGFYIDKETTQELIEQMGTQN
jgi:predicted transcriptional regulator